MPPDILNIDAEPVESRPVLIKTVMNAVGELPGFWKAWISQSPDNPSSSMRIDGHDEGQFSYGFEKPHEQPPEFIYRTIHDGVRRVSRLRVASMLLQPFSR